MPFYDISFHGAWIHTVLACLSQPVKKYNKGEGNNQPALVFYIHIVSHNRSKNIIKVKGTTNLHWFSIFIWFSHGQNVLCIVRHMAWHSCVCMTNNLLCILHDVGYIQTLDAEIFMFEIVVDGRTPDHGYTKSSPSSLQLRWAKNLLQNTKSYDLKTLHASSENQALQSLYKWWPWVDLDLFYCEVTLGCLNVWMGQTVALKSLKWWKLAPKDQIDLIIVFYGKKMPPGVVCPWPRAIYMYMITIFKDLFL